MERIHDLCIRIALLCRPLWRRLGDLRVECVQVNPRVYARVGEGLHAAVVVAGGVDMVDADAVCADSLHKRCVEGALLRRDERVVGNELVRYAWGEVLVCSADCRNIYGCMVGWNLPLTKN
jgi:hypothetical protein